jgi:hypothetical protein
MLKGVLMAVAFFALLGIAAPPRRHAADVDSKTKTGRPVSPTGAAWKNE